MSILVSRNGLGSTTSEGDGVEWLGITDIVGSYARMTLLTIPYLLYLLHYCTYYTLLIRLYMWYLCYSYHPTILIIFYLLYYNYFTYFTYALGLFDSNENDASQHLVGSRHSISVCFCRSDFLAFFPFGDLKKECERGLLEDTKQTCCRRRWGPEGDDINKNNS